MNFFLKIVAIFTFIGTLSSCDSDKKDTSTTNTISLNTNAIDTAKWFIGTWQNQIQNNVFTEQWKQKNDSVYVGVSTGVANNKDTVFYESVSLEQHKGSLFYIVSVKDQNNALPVSFKLTSVTDKQLVFENPEHDFPKKITYLKVTEDSIVASISGIVNGKEMLEHFPMKKIN